jgi:hypothetical protein
MFLETSALANENITESFQQCARIILSKIESGYFICLVLIEIIKNFDFYLGSIDPFRMYSGIQCNRSLADHQNESLANAVLSKSSQNCALCKT